jgi:hypothetical protein
VIAHSRGEIGLTAACGRGEPAASHLVVLRSAAPRRAHGDDHLDRDGEPQRQLLHTDRPGTLQIARQIVDEQAADGVFADRPRGKPERLRRQSPERDVAGRVAGAPHRPVPRQGRPV